MKLSESQIEDIKKDLNIAYTNRLIDFSLNEYSRNDGRPAELRQVALNKEIDNIIYNYEIILGLDLETWKKQDSELRKTKEGWKKAKELLHEQVEAKRLLEATIIGLSNEIHESRSNETIYDVRPDLAHLQKNKWTKKELEALQEAIKKNIERED